MTSRKLPMTSGVGLEKSITNRHHHFDQSALLSPLQISLPHHQWRKRMTQSRMTSPTNERVQYANF